MTDQPRVILSGFADEAAHQKTAGEQFVAFAALGLQYYSIRFIDVGHGVKHVMKLTLPEIQKIRQLQNEYSLNVSSIGSSLGKVKLADVEDGTRNEFIPFKKYLAGEVQRTCELAHAFETKLVRGFSFYPPKGSDPRAYLAQAVDQLGQIAEACHRSDLSLGLEIEANLVGANGHLAAEIYQQVNHPGMVLIFDAANVLVQGYSPAEVFEQYLAMKPGLAWMHVKNYCDPAVKEGGQSHFRAEAARLDPKIGTVPATAKGGYVNVEALTHFVPADQGQGVYEAVLRDFSRTLPALEKKLNRRGIPGVFLDLEPHLKGGGQFGGTSGPDGMGVALRGLLRILDYLDIDYHLRDFDDVKAARGF